MAKITKIETTQSKTSHVKNFNGYVKKSTDSDKIAFTSKEQLGISKFQKFFYATFLKAGIEENEGGMFTRVIFKLGGKLKQVSKINDKTCHDKFVFFHKNGKTVKKRMTYGMLPNGKEGVAQEIKYDKNGKEYYRAFTMPSGDYAISERFKNGNIYIEVGSMDKRMKISESFIHYISKRGQHISEQEALRGLDMLPPKKADAIRLKIKVKDIENFKNSHQKSVDKIGQQKAGILVVENPYFEQFKTEISKVPKFLWALRNFSLKSGLDIQPPNGLKPDDILNVYILKSADLLAHYEDFADKKVLGAIEINKKAVVKDFWETTSCKRNDLRDPFDEEIMGKLPEAKADSDFINQARIMGLCAENAQYDGIFQEMLSFYNIKSPELNQKIVREKISEPKEGKKLGWKLPPSVASR